MNTFDSSYIQNVTVVIGTLKFRLIHAFSLFKHDFAESTFFQRSCGRKTCEEVRIFCTSSFARNNMENLGKKLIAKKNKNYASETPLIFRLRVAIHVGKSYETVNPEPPDYLNVVKFRSTAG